MTPEELVDALIDSACLQSLLQRVISDFVCKRYSKQIAIVTGKVSNIFNVIRRVRALTLALTSTLDSASENIGTASNASVFGFRLGQLPLLSFAVGTSITFIELLQTYVDDVDILIDTVENLITDITNDVLTYVGDCNDET